MRRTFKLLPLLMVVSLTACKSIREASFPCFDTGVRIKITSEDATPVKEIKKLCNKIDAYADSYRKRDVVGVYDLNHTNEKLKIDADFYDLLLQVKEAQKVASYFNPLVGSLSNKWKEALKNNQVLSNEVIQEELLKISSSSLEIEAASDGFYAQRIGEAEIDLGGAAKGYALDMAQHYLEYEYFNNDDGDYIVNTGSSSLLFGKNSIRNSNGNYKVEIEDLPTAYFYIGRSIVSTSSISRQGKEIGGVKYSHIVNPITGSAINYYDAVIVTNYCDVYGNGVLGDALSTSLMMSTTEEIKTIEETAGVKVIAIKDGKIVYGEDSYKIYNYQK